MMDFLQKYFSHKKINRKTFLDYFFSLPEHQWMNEENGFQKKHIENLVQVLPSALLEKIMTTHPVSFVLNNELQKFSPEIISKSVVVVFPEFQKLLQSSKKAALAFLAHEIALTLVEIENNQRDSLMNEIEADKFVSDLGLTFELEQFLLMLDETLEKRMRLTYLTIHHFNDGEIA